MGRTGWLVLAAMVGLLLSGGGQAVAQDFVEDNVQLVQGHGSIA